YLCKEWQSRFACMVGIVAKHFLQALADICQLAGLDIVRGDNCRRGVGDLVYERPVLLQLPFGFLLFRYILRGSKYFYRFVLLIDYDLTTGVQYFQSAIWYYNAIMKIERLQCFL